MSNYGLLGGLGQSMQNIGMQMRQDAIAARKEKAAAGARQEDRDFQQGLNDQNIASREKIAGMNQKGHKPDLDPMVKSRINSLNEQIKSITGNQYASPEDKARLHKLTSELDQLQGSTAPPSRDPYMWDRASERADEWIDSAAKYSNFDETDFKDYGGNREQARHQKTLEFYQDMVGADSGGRPQSSRPDAGLMSGNSSKPTEADILKQYPTAKKAPDGNYYVIKNGQYYRVD